MRTGSHNTQRYGSCTLRCNIGPPGEIHPLAGMIGLSPTPLPPMTASSRSRSLLPVPPRPELGLRVGDALIDVLGRVPSSRERAQPAPDAQARTIARAAAARAALTAAGLALPPGPLGWLTVLPELVAVWRLQAQMVADIAAVYGRQSGPSREQMIHCLFRHSLAQAVRDLLARGGGRLLAQEIPVRALQTLAAQLGRSLSRRAIGRSLGRWLPVVGAVGVGAYAYYDTLQVARTARELFATT
jgi:hypothetical protein